MSINWYVLRSKPNKEDFLAEQLASRDVEVFFPQLRVKPVNPRSRKIKPYFPGYLFIHIDLEKNSHVAFDRIPGAVNLVTFGGEIGSVPDYIVHGIRLKVDEINSSGGEVLNVIKPGDKIKIDKGPFEGYEGIFDTKVSGTQRVRVLLSMLQKRQLPVELPAGFVSVNKPAPNSR